jgi:hypothetical protein
MRSAVVVAGAMLSLGLACSGEQLPYAGGLMVALQTDLAAPKDIAAVGLYITSDGKPIFGDTRNVAPNGEVKFPATLAVLADADRPRAVLKIRAVAFKPDGDIRVLRDVITTIPKGRTALLRMPLLWINEGSGTGNRSQLLGSANIRPRDVTADGFSRLTSACPDGQTFIEGECADARVDGDALPDYVDADVFGGGNAAGTGGTCYDVLGCFAGATPLALDSATCIGTVTGTDDPNLSLAVALPAAADTGECGDGRCLVPLDKGTGWKVAGAGVEFPRALCRKIADGRATGVVVSRACPTKDSRTPSCGPASSVTVSSSAGPAGDAGSNPGTGTQDFEVPIAFGSEPNLTDVAVDADFLFVSRATANPPPSSAIRLRKADVIAQVNPETSVLSSFGGDPAVISAIALDPAVRASHVVVHGGNQLGLCTPTSANDCTTFNVLGPPEVIASGPDEAYSYGSFNSEVGLVAIPYASPSPVVRQILPAATPVSSLLWAQGALYVGTIEAAIFRCVAPCESAANVTQIRPPTSTPAIVTALAASDKVPGKIFFLQIPADAVTLSAAGVFAIDSGGANEVRLAAGAELAGIGTSAQPPTALAVDSEYVYWSGSFDDPRGGGRKSGLMARNHVTLAPPRPFLEDTQATDTVSAVAVDDTHVFWTYNRTTRALVFSRKRRAF